MINSMRGRRGGAWNSFEANLNSSARNYASPTNEYDIVGFRVASIPEPAAVGLVLGGAALLARRMRKNTL